MSYAADSNYVLQGHGNIQQNMLYIYMSYTALHIAYLKPLLLKHEIQSKKMPNKGPDFFLNNR